MLKHELSTAPETKAMGDDVTGAFDEFMHAFDAFKDANDDRLGQLEKRMSADVFTTEKVDRISRAMDEQKRAMDQLTLKATRPPLGRDGKAVAQPSEHKTAFDAYIRRGDERAMNQLEAKAFSVGTPSDGGYLVPSEMEAEIGKRMAMLSPIRAISSVRQISAGVLKKPFATTGFAAGWSAETAARTQSATPVLAELQFPAMELYAMPAATVSLLDDAAVDMDSWIAQEVEAVFAEQEGTAFVTGDGVNKPRGFLNYTAVAESAWTWGNLGYIATGVAGGLPATNPSDVLIDTIYALKAGYRQNGTFVMNRKTQAIVRKLKDAQGNYLWQPPATAGAQAQLMGFPLVEAEDMPDIAANATPIAFGNFQRGYLVVDRVGVRILRDPYSAKPYVLFYTTKRVGGGVQDFNAIKLLKIAVS
ncbi:MAG: phage major capsid protein [Rhizobiaceae bacterium]